MTPPPPSKRSSNTGGHPNKRRKVKAPKEGGSEEVLLTHIKNLHLQLQLEAAPTTESTAATTTETTTTTESIPLPEPFSLLELTITELTSTGDGLAAHNGRIYVVPFSIPGDKVSAKVVKHFPTYTSTDFISVVTPSTDRDDSLVSCQYFSKCGGCQFQMLPYGLQLAHKKKVVEKAYAHYCDIPDKGILPPVGETIGSPLQYGYRTKLTPHFDGPRRVKEWPKVPEIGFQLKGRRFVLDIEDCPIGTPAVREGLKKERKHVHDNLHTYKRGATLLLRESTVRTPKEKQQQGEMTTEVEKVSSAAAAESQETDGFVEEKTCITDSNATSVEYIGNFRFENPAGSFFQNNNSILPKFTDYVRSKLHLPIPTSSSGTPSTSSPKYLVDAYCGSGLFTITCGQPFAKAIGVDVSTDSITSARRNATLNSINNADFIVGKAETIFEKITFPGDQTSCVIDPSRKGCDKLFLDQLLQFRPRRIVYVSCNVHTQARDLGYILGEEAGRGYRVDSIVGFDFFPMTHHVESVAVLTMVE